MKERDIWRKMQTLMIIIQKETIDYIVFKESQQIILYDCPFIFCSNYQTFDGPVINRK